MTLGEASNRQAMDSDTASESSSIGDVVEDTRRRGREFTGKIIASSWPIRVALSPRSN